MLNFSVFDNDGTLGDVLARGVASAVQGSPVRLMTLQVTLSFLGSMLAPMLSLFRDEAGVVRAQLETNGWIVRSIAKTSTNLGGVGAYTFLIDVELHGNFSDSEVVNTARSVLSQIGSNVRVAISRQTVAYVNANTAGSASALTGSFDDWIGNATNNLAAGLGTGLGISSPVVLLTGGVILVLLLKR